MLNWVNKGENLGRYSNFRGKNSILNICWATVARLIYDLSRLDRTNSAVSQPNNDNDIILHNVIFPDKQFSWIWRWSQYVSRKIYLTDSPNEYIGNFINVSHCIPCISCAIACNNRATTCISIYRPLWLAICYPVFRSDFGLDFWNVWNMMSSWCIKLDYLIDFW